MAAGLWGGEEKDGFRQSGDEVFRWDDRPGFVPMDPSRSGATANIAWSPAYSSVFRASFPGSSGKISVLGRSVTELRDLRADDSLVDEMLGKRGAIYVCDRSGTLLASAMAGEQAFVQREGGVFRFRRIDEVQASWTSKLKEFDGKKQEFSEGGFYVVVQPLSGRGLSNFSAVVAAQRDMFVDSRLSPMLEGAKIVAVLPYPVFLIVWVGFKLYKEHIRRRNLRRVHVLHEGIATLVHEAVPDVNMPDTGDTMTALRKRILAKTEKVSRDANTAMSHFIENSSKAKGQCDAHGMLMDQIKHHNKA